MKIAEQIAALKEEQKALIRKIEVTTNFLNESKVTFDSTCPFCGKSRKTLRACSEMVSYVQCGCEENQKALTEYRKVFEDDKNLKNDLEIVELKLAHFEQRGRRLLEESNLGRRFRDRTFENFEPKAFTKAYSTAQRFAHGFEKNKGQSLLLTGTPGTGKTHLAAAITNYVITEYGIPVKFGSFIDILDDVKKAFGTDAEVVRELIDIPLLVIDDLGKERQTEWSTSILYQVINGRYENYLPVVITTNETMAELEQNIGRATLSRLIEMCSGVKMDGRDYRKAKLA